MKTIVMTGGTAGIGLAALKRMQQSPHVRILLGARGSNPTDCESLPLDMARLSSVRSFAAAIEKKLGETSIDALVLNAGTQVSKLGQHTDDGYETTFAVNHLAHYLLLRLLMPKLASGAIVLITTSNLHDPTTNPMAPPEHADAAKLARGQIRLDKDPSDSRSAMRAYAASKLCNILTAYSLASSPFARQRSLRVIAFNPGLTPGTNLFRNHGLAFRVFFSVFIPLLGPFLRINTLSGGGALLADLALGSLVPPVGRTYASQVKRRLTWPDPSELVREGVASEKLWGDSATLVGLTEASSQPSGK
jgi:NAD(P)-dependent dehydrogenase (short-subunit alcohol dehydrogenase family)